jgi:hypothetical protein
MSFVDTTGVLLVPRFYFHVSAPDQDFQDDVGSEVGDLAAVHSRAVLLADRVITSSCFCDSPLDFRRWTVKVTDETQRPVITVIFPDRFACAEGQSRFLFPNLKGVATWRTGDRRTPAYVPRSSAASWCPKCASRIASHTFGRSLRRPWRSSALSFASARAPPNWTPCSIHIRRISSSSDFLRAAQMPTKCWRRLRPENTTAWSCSLVPLIHRRWRPPAISARNSACQ